MAVFGRERQWRAVGAVLLFAVATARAQVTTEVKLRDVRWQALPADIRGVCVGPDQRPWYEALPIQGKDSIADFKAEIEKQWKSAAPVLHGLHPVLFEKGGRTWFLTPDSRTLLAYDGQNWIEQPTHAPAEANVGFKGDAAEHGHTQMTPVNVDLGGYQLFQELGGISAFDGKKWSYQEMAQEGGVGTASSLLLPESGGKAAIIVQCNPPRLWRFAEGKFADIPLPVNVRGGIVSAALGGDGNLLLQSQGGITKMRVGAPLSKEALEKQFNQYLNKIDNPDAKVADAAADSIAELGPEVAPLVKKVLENIVDTDAETRLERVLARLDNPAAAGEFQLPGIQNVGRGRAAAPNFSRLQASVWNGPEGSVLVSAMNLPRSAAPQPEGTFIIKQDGSRQFVPGAFHFNGSSNAGAPFFKDGGKTLWLMTNGAAVSRVDLSGPEVTVQRLPDAAFSMLQGVLPDGTAFLSTLAPVRSASEPVKAQLIAWKASAKEDRQILKATTIETDMTGAILAGDGSLLAALSDKGIARFDGREWTALLNHHAQGTMLFPGKNGEVLVWQNQYFALLPGARGGDVLEGSGLEDFVRQNAVAVSEAFRAPTDPRLFHRTMGRNTTDPWASSGNARDEGWSIATDKEGRLWMTVGTALRALDAGGWSEAHGPDGGPLSASLVVPVGEGSIMYVRGSRAAGNGAKCYFASFKDGQIALSVAPACDDTGLFVDADRALWVMKSEQPIATRAPARGGMVRLEPHKTIVQRVTMAADDTAPRLQEPFALEQPPVLLDKSDVIWLSPTDDRFDLWQRGNIVGHVDVPGAVTYPATAPQLFSDKAGSVWVWTALGLRHYQASADHPADYSLKGTYAVEGGEGNLFNPNPIEDEGVSSRGFIYRASSPPFSNGRRQYFLNIAPLPAN